MPNVKSRKNKPYKRVLALPDLEHAKTAVLNSLTSASGQRTYEYAIASLWRGTAPSRGSPSTRLWCCRIDATWSHAGSRHLRSTFGFPRSDWWRTRRPTPPHQPQVGCEHRTREDTRSVGVQLENWLSAERDRAIIAVLSLGVLPRWRRRRSSSSSSSPRRPALPHRRRPQAHRSARAE